MTSRNVSGHPRAGFRRPVNLRWTRVPVAVTLDSSAGAARHSVGRVLGDAAYASTFRLEP